MELGLKGRKAIATGARLAPENGFSKRAQARSALGQTIYGG